MSQPIINTIMFNTDVSVILLEVTGSGNASSPDQAINGYISTKSGTSASALALPVYGRLDSRMLQIFINGQKQVIWYHPGPAPGNPDQLGYYIYVGADSQNPVWSGAAGSGNFKLIVNQDNSVTITPN